MGKKANPTLIGAFVVGAVALAIVGVVVFGSGRLSRDVSSFVCFFSGSVDGLSVGGPVKFKGVEIGQVSEILINLGDFRPQEARIPVYIEIDNKRLRARGASVDPDNPSNVKRLIDQGLRAQLQPQSLVTGVVFVQLDMHPDTPIELFLPPDSPTVEIPTVPTTLERAQQAMTEILAELDRADIDKLVTSLRHAVDGIDRIASSPGLQEGLDRLPATMDEMKATLENVRRMVARLDKNLDPLMSSVRTSFDAADVALQQMDLTLRRVQSLADPDGALAAALYDLSEAAQSIRILADYLERNPGALLRGRAKDKP